jgi:hypothetical protein
METTEAWLLIGAVLVVFFALYLVVRNEIVRRRLVCPRTGATAEVELVRRSEGRHKPVRVLSCSLFADPRQVDCGQDCIHAG